MLVSSAVLSNLSIPDLLIFLMLRNTHIHTHTHTHARTHSRTHSRTHARTHARTNTLISVALCDVWRSDLWNVIIGFGVSRRSQLFHQIVKKKTKKKRDDIICGFNCGEELRHAIPSARLTYKNTTRSRSSLELEGVPRFWCENGSILIALDSVL